jgi:hypothetical protein
MKRAIVLLVLAACSKQDAEPGSCYRERDSACVEHPRAQAAAGKRLCTGFRWTPGEGTCPKENRVGTCTRDGHDEVLYGGPPNYLTPATAKTQCEAAGGSMR